MILAAMLLQAAPPMPPQDWTTLPVFPMPRTAVLADASAFVHGEVDAGRCHAQTGSDGKPQMIATVAMLVGATGAVTRIVPRAIDCPTVEQYTVGYLQSLTRGGPGSALPPVPGWYRLVVTYQW